MNRQLYTFLWSHWRAHNHALALLWGLSIAAYLAFWYVDSKMFLLIDSGFALALMYLFWVAGMAFLFIEESPSGFRWTYPARHFTLPLATWKQAAANLLYLNLTAGVHTAITILVPVYLLDGTRTLPQFASLVVGAFLLVTAAQWATLLHSRMNAARAIGRVIGFVAVFLVAAWLLLAQVDVEKHQSAKALSLALVPTILCCFHACGVARHGGTVRSSVGRIVGRSATGRTPARRGLLARLPAAPLWAQAWLEFRSTAFWFPVSFLPICAFLLFPSLAADGLALDAWDLGALSSLGLALAFATGYLWERGNRTTTLFCMGVPLPSTTLTAARVLAGFFSIAIAVIGAGAILLAGVTASANHGSPVFELDEVFAITGTLAASSAPLWWIALSAGRVIALALLPSIAIAMAYASTPGGASEIMGLFWAVLVLALTTFGMSLWARRKCGAPAAWPISLVLLLTANPLIAMAMIDTPESLESGAWMVEIVIPPLAALAILYQAKRVAGYPMTVLAGMFCAFGLLFALLRTTLPWQTFNVGILSTEAAGFAAAGVLLPLAWIPVLVRLQRAA